MLNEMRPGDTLLYYHSNCKKPGIAGLATVRALARTSFAAEPALDMRWPTCRHVRCRPRCRSARSRIRTCPPSRLADRITTRRRRLLLPGASVFFAFALHCALLLTAVRSGCIGPGAHA